MIRVQADPFDPGAELSGFMERAGDAGGIVSFVGVVRETREQGTVTVLDLDHYPGFTEKVIGGICEEAGRRFDITAQLVIHRYGPLKPGEPIVFVATASRHRRAAFEAADYLMDRLKTEAPFWKREHGADGAKWIEAREGDVRDRARWDQGESSARDR